MLVASFASGSRFLSKPFVAFLSFIACLMAISNPLEVFRAATVFAQGGPTTFTITGIVRDKSNQGVSGVRVTVTDENNLPIYTGFIDSSGRFTVKNLRQGRHVLRIETTGTPYEEYSQAMELQSLRQFGGNEIIPVDIILKPKRGTEPSPRAGSVFAQDVPKAARSEYERGVNNLKGNKPDAGISCLKKALEVFPDYFDALEALGTEYVKGNQHETALPILLHAVEVNKRGARSLYALGVAYLRLNQLKEATEALEKAAQLDSNNPNTQMMLGLAYGNNHAADKSEAAFRKALQLGGPAAAEAHYYLTGLYNKQEQYRKAWQELELFLREAKDLKDPQQIKAMIAALKQKEKAQAAGPSTPNTSVSQPVNEAASSQPAVTTSPTINTTSVSPNDSAGPAVERTTPESIAPKSAPIAAPPAAEPIAVPPLPAEYVELLNQATANGPILHKQLLEYTYQLKKTHRVLNERGNPTQTQEQVFEAYPVRGEHVLILLSRDGITSKSLSDDRKKAAKQLEEAERLRNSKDAQGNSLEKSINGYVSAGVTGSHQGRTGYVSIDVSAVLQSCEFFSPRVEKIGDREMVVLSYRHRAGAKLDRNHAYVAGLVGTVWIDQADKVLTRLEGWPAVAAAFDLVQTTAPHDEAALIYQQALQPDGTWFPSVIRMNAGGRANLFDGLNWDVVFEFSNYQRFNTSGSEKLNDPQKPKP